MAVKATVTVNTSGLDRKAVRMVSALQAEGKEVAMKARDFAKQQAPKRSRRLANLIGVYTIEGHGKTTYQIISKNPVSGYREMPNSGKYAGSFSMPKWLDETGGVLKSLNKFLLYRTKGRLGHVGDKIIKNGNPRYMDATRKWIKDNGSRLVRDGFKRRIK